MSYELMRSAFHSQLSNRLAPELLNDVLQTLDRVAVQYDIKRVCTDLIVPGALPDVAKMYLAALAVENKAKGTIDGYHRTLKKFFKSINKPYYAITTNDIRVYLYQYQQSKNAAKSTLENVRVVINAFYSWLVDEELIERNPARRISPIEQHRDTTRTAMTPLELEYLRQACIDPREKALVDFLYSTGVRISECADVQLTDINWENRSILIRHGKGDKSRTVYFNPEAEVSMKDYLASKPHESKYLFSRSRAPYGKVTSKALQDIIAAICSRVSDKLKTHITPHVFRHTMATTAIRNGMPVEQVQQLLGHSSLDTTMIYTHTDQSEVRANHNKYIA